MNSQTLSIFTKTSLHESLNLLRPAPKVTGSEWANANRILSREDSAEPGRYSTERAPFQREPLDEITDPRNQIIVLMWSSQIGKTLIAQNAMGYFMDYEPSSIMYMIETLQKAENFSKARLEPMIRDNSWMQIDNAKTSHNTILEKFYPGGYLSIVGANSPSGLSSKPIRVLIADEVDNYPLSAGKLGSPLNLAMQRTETYDNRKIIIISSPGVEGMSKVHPYFMQSDQRYYFVPCPNCGKQQRLVWAQMKFPDRKPENSYYECINCREKLTEKDKFRMIEEGGWQKQNPEILYRPGFQLSRMYSVFSPWKKMVEDFLEAKKISLSGDTGALQVFINSSLAELWKPNTAPTSSQELLKRVENYRTVPLLEKIVLLTCGIDVQDDRIELEVKGWGVGEESWTIDYKILNGEPALPYLWNELDKYLQTKWKHASGLMMGITATAIDSGHFTDQVYKFVRGKHARRIYAIKGSAFPGKSPAPRIPTYNNKGKIPLYNLGTSSIKDMIYSRLRIEVPGDGYMHFHQDFATEEYFEQLTSEIKIRYKLGFRYEQMPGRRNEVLDVNVYNIGALRIYNRDLKVIKQILETTAKRAKDGKPLNKDAPRVKYRKSFAMR